MTQRINGTSFKIMIEYGVSNLNKHCQMINRLNVFPVPDGDTGTNMVVTIAKGLRSMQDSADLSVVAKSFADSIIYGARGNSGVIVAQFLKGISESFIGITEADTHALIDALGRGVTYAYNAVATPVEGTMLTVVKDAFNCTKQQESSFSSIDSVFNFYIDSARVSLDNTPELLPTLKEAGVVDSGGAGILCFLEGIKMYFDGEAPSETSRIEVEDAAPDYSAFNKDSTFPYGYCTELLIQLLSTKEPFDIVSFTNQLKSMGESVVISPDNDKVRIHIHTHYPEQIFTFCHRFGEFLNLKVENMTVQHTDTVKAIMCSEQKSNGKFSVVAVASSQEIQKLFLQMGADIAIYSHDSASIKDYLDAFEMVTTSEIIVFPNSSDSVLTALQATKIYDKKKVHIISSKSIAQCYAALPIIDFTKDTQEAVEDINHTLENLYVVSVIKRNDTERGKYLSHAGKNIIAVSDTLEDAVCKTAQKVQSIRTCDIMTVFCATELDQTVDEISRTLSENGTELEVFTVNCRTASLMLLCFE